MINLPRLEAGIIRHTELRLLVCLLSDPARGLPKFRRHADDRAPKLEEIQKICEYPDRRIKAIVYTMASLGIRLGAWDYFRWGNVQPILQEGNVIAAKIIVYAGDE